jgi:hypothetical protein
MPGPYGPPPFGNNVFVTVGGTQYDGPQVNFTWVAAPPVITWVSQTAAVTGISPTSGDYPGGQTMTITGTGFSEVVEVDFTVATSGVGPSMGGQWYSAAFTINSDTQITATVPAIPAGYAYGYIFYVTVTTGAGVSPYGAVDSSNAVACAFTYNPA